MKYTQPMKIMENCRMCGRTFQYGPHVYNGQMISAYRLLVCLDCHHSNHDGWSPLFEARLEQHLRENGIPFPDRNRQGLYPRGQ